MPSTNFHYFSSVRLSVDPKPPLGIMSKLLHGSPTRKFSLVLPQKETNFFHNLDNRVSSSMLSRANKGLVEFAVSKAWVYLVGALAFVSFLGLKPRCSLASSSLSSKLLADTGETHVKTVEKSEREVLYEILLETEPNNLMALKVVLQERIKRGEGNEAVKYVERLINAEPEEMEWRLLEAFCYETMGDLDKAKSLFIELLKTRPLLLRALHGLAMVMHKAGEESFDILNEALMTARTEKKMTEERNIRILKGQMNVLKGELAEGLSEFEALISENSGDFRPYLCQGIIYSLLGQQEEALKSFEKYRILVPEEFPQRDFLEDMVMQARNEELLLYRKASIEIPQNNNVN